MTNPEEAFGFKECSWYTWSYSSGIGLILWTYLLYWSNLGMKAVVNLNTTRPMRSAMLIASLVAF